MLPTEVKIHLSERQTKPGVSIKCLICKEMGTGDGGANADGGDSRHHLLKRHMFWAQHPQASSDLWEAVCYGVKYIHS